MLILKPVLVVRITAQSFLISFLFRTFYLSVSWKRQRGLWDFSVAAIFTSWFLGRRWELRARRCETFSPQKDKWLWEYFSLPTSTQFLFFYLTFSEIAPLLLCHETVQMSFAPSPYSHPVSHTHTRKTHKTHTYYTHARTRTHTPCGRGTAGWHGDERRYLWFLLLGAGRNVSSVLFWMTADGACLVLVDFIILFISSPRPQLKSKPQSIAN